MREKKFRFWDERSKTMFYDDTIFADMSVNDFLNSGTSLQYIGLQDKSGKEYYFEDIGEFNNGDRFIVKCEEWLEPYVEWIGNPKCEDQARDLYRISNAKIIGNTYENKELA